ncbi:MAG: hypothetical protein LBG90_02330 [Spirochaetaceae bacterium]|nr:hypothetical protein [Spirochaetaceae bacterium]
MRFISKLSFFAFPKGRVLLGFMAVLLTFPACQNPTSTEDAPSTPGKEFQDLDITLASDFSSCLVGHILKESNLTVKIRYTDGTLSSDLRMGIDYTTDWESIRSRPTPQTEGQQTQGEKFHVTYLGNGYTKETSGTVMINLPVPYPETTTGITGNLSTVAFNNGQWAAGGKNSSGESLVVKYNASSDSWSTISANTDTVPITASGVGNGYFVFSYTFLDGAQTGIAYSNNLQQGRILITQPFITVGTSPNDTSVAGFVSLSNSDIRGIAFGNDRFVAVGNNGLVARSNVTSPNTTPPASWEAATSVAPFYQSGEINCVIHDGTRFIAGGKVGTAKIITSTDGFNWNELLIGNSNVSNSFFGNIKSMAYSPEYGYVLVSQPSASTSYLAHTSRLDSAWTMVTSQDLMTASPALVFNAVAYNGDGLFVAVGKSNKIAYSVDGVTWKLLPPLSVNAGTLQAIAHGNGKFVAVSSTAKIVSLKLP